MTPEHGTITSYKAGCHCPPCTTANATYGRGWRERNPTSARQSSRNWQKRNPEKRAAQQKRYGQNHRRPERSRLHLYGITPEALKGLLQAQAYCCAGCHEPFAGRTPHVDHDHAAAAAHGHKKGRCCPLEVGGLLCAPCNFSLGNLQDDPKRLLNLLAYLQRSRRAA